MTEVTSAPPQVQLDQQDPLPESNWTWRRGFTYVSSIVEAAACGVLLWMLYHIAGMLHDMRSLDGLLRIAGYLARIAFYLILLIATDKILYMIAPSAEQATKMIQTASMFKHGVEFRAKQSATSSADGSTGASTTEITSARSGPSGGTDTASTGIAQPSADAAASPAPAPASAPSLPDLPPSQRPEAAGMGQKG